MEQLRHRIQKIEYLRDEEEQQCFAEMAQDANHRERHAGQIAEGVADKYPGWISEKNNKRLK